MLHEIMTLNENSKGSEMHINNFYPPQIVEASILNVFKHLKDFTFNQYHWFCIKQF